jgi:hypothetical protein
VIHYDVDPQEIQMGVSESAELRIPSVPLGYPYREIPKKKISV